MLQQTQVKTVIPFFENFIKKIPNLKALAKVNDQKLLKCWEGLGYYSRARNLKKTAKIIIENFNEKLPNNINQLKSLPGIGEYTSSSISAILKDESCAVIDGNIERILLRVFDLNRSEKNFKKKMWKTQLNFQKN